MLLTCVCVSDFGFSESSFSGREQGESYRVQVEFFSEEITTGFFFYPTLDLSGTASKYDNNYQYIFNNDYYITSKHSSRSICKMVDT